MLRSVLAMVCISATCALQMAPSFRTSSLPQLRVHMGASRSESPGARGVVAAALALALSSANPTFTPAVDVQLAPVQHSSALIADVGENMDLRPEQKKFLEERAKMKTEYETSVASSFKTADETSEAKDIYTTIVGGLILIAVVVPMVQFFYYTGGE